MQNQHENIVSVLDHGIANENAISGPFCVMRKFNSNLRQLIQDNIPEDKILPLFSQILDGIEAAHLNQVIHRDLKPENILYNPDNNILAICDFGIARFSEDLLATIVKTKDTKRLANFQYSAPEQRQQGTDVTHTADIYALGLILNEMFTGQVPQGTEYMLIGSLSANFAFLDEIVANMIRQNPIERPQSVSEIKVLINRHHSEAIRLQKISEIDNTVIGENEIDDPLAFNPPKLVDFDWDGRNLTLILDREISQKWVDAICNLGSFSSVLGKSPEVFRYYDNCAEIDAMDHEVQPIIDNFKTWLPQATKKLRQIYEYENSKKKFEQEQRLKQEREHEERRLRVIKATKI